VLGGISATLEQRYPGIAIESVCLTFGTMFRAVAGYRSGMIKVTQKFRLGVIAATGRDFPVLHGGNFAGILRHSLHCGEWVGLAGDRDQPGDRVRAALNLVLDFDFIESGVAAGAPKYMEWYGAFGLMVTLVWLYLEMLRLMAKLRGRR